MYVVEITQLKKVQFIAINALQSDNSVSTGIGTLLFYPQKTQKPAKTLEIIFTIYLKDRQLTISAKLFCIMIDFQCFLSHKKPHPFEVLCFDKSISFDLF